MQLLLEAAVLEPSRAFSSWLRYLEKNDLQTVDASAISLLPLVYCNLKEKSHPLCKSAYRHTWLTNQTLWSKTLPILHQFLAAGIEKIALLKGMALILHHYRNFGARVIGDIDILIDRAHVPLAHSLLIAAGWRTSWRKIDPERPHQISPWHSANFTHPDSLNLDLHWSLLLESNPALDRKVLDALPPGIHPLSPADLLFQTCIHGYKKSTAPLIRWIPDALTILKSPVDFSRLFELARDSHLTLPLATALSDLSRRFAVSIPPFTAQPTRLERREFRANLRGHVYLAGYYRARLNNRTLIDYLCRTANLRSAWMIPLYAPYWVLKRLFKKARKCFPGRSY